MIAKEVDRHVTFVSAFVSVAVAYKDGLHTNLGGTTMSTAHLGVRLFHFLAVVAVIASASFIVLMLGTRSHADQNLSLMSPTTSSSQTAQSHFRGMLHSAQFQSCAQCTAYYMNNCLRSNKCGVTDDICFQKCGMTANYSCNDLCRR
jgi:hypothetical protein